MNVIRSLKEVAKAAGVSTMTVSRVMRNSNLVTPGTRRRVLAAAETLGYRPDPVAARLMSRVRKAKKAQTRDTLAFVCARRPHPAPNDGHQYVQIDDVRARAEIHGYTVDEFFLGKGALSPPRLQSILAARGIEGVLFSAEAPLRELKEFDFSRFASVTFGYGLQSPSLHRASTNMMQGLLSAFEWLERRHYQRIGLAITPWANSRSDQTYSGAILNYQQSIPPRRRVPLLLFPHDQPRDNRRLFGKWLATHKPDVIISFDQLVPDWITEDAGQKIPEDIGFLVHDWTARAARFSGINHNRDHVVAAAVDLTATQLFHGERGIPDVPRQILIPSTLIDQGSCPPRT
ncbi:MAG: LacI family DNA-binding transcriptional regulator [Chthoniobacterales bacterium]|nr:LacI family DNA-binding transcriptional regulator [Chthoniobacterales bacterium]